MRGQQAYPELQPRWYRPRISTWWWLKRRSHLMFILRELSSLFVAWFVVFLLLLIRALRGGPEAYREFFEWAERPAVLFLNLAAFLFVVFHAVTWFSLAPQALVVHLRGRRVPGAWIAAAHYGAWVLVSAFLAWLIVRR